jgi:hypothetical protein
MSIHVFSPEEVIDDINSGKKDVLQIKEKTYKSKNKSPVKYLDLIINTKKHSGPAIFSLDNVEINYGLPDPSYDDDDDGDSTRNLSVATTVDKAGKFGEMIELLNPLFLKEVDRCAEQKIIVKSRRNIKELISTHYSENRTDEKAGKAFDSPLINVKLDFSTYPDNYFRKFLRGKPKTQVFDYTKSFIDDDGRKQYKYATTADGDKLDDANAHMFITSECVIKTGRIHMESVAVSQNWISVITKFGKIVVDPISDGGFDDEDDGDFDDAEPQEPAGNKDDEADEGEDDGEEGEDDGEVDDFLDDV